MVLPPATQSINDRFNARLLRGSSAEQEVQKKEAATEEEKIPLSADADRCMACNSSSTLPNSKRRAFPVSLGQ